ncbi:DMT family transporter [Succinatimonas hippei]|uniref:DMT family transporter n=1 Tax=Succinatimonas hippei TaxID=626938 RepID=UPI0026EB3B93|nr:DMT family transporter [Succinatimonas hippei]
MENKILVGHLLSLLTIFIWGTTFISTKVLLESFLPIEILFLRFLLGFLALWIICPKKLGILPLNQEIMCAFAGLCGVCLYYLLENIALVYTTASNVGIIICLAPFFTAILSALFIKGQENLGISFFAGMVIAFIGVGMICFSHSQIRVNPLGDFLAILASFAWACYSVFTRKIASFGFNTVLTTRHVFFYGLLFMLLCLPVFDFNVNLESIFNLNSFLNIIFLGIGASALCFVTWNFAIKCLGTVKCSAYIYLVPVVTVASAVLVLNEPLSFSIVCGMLLTLIGLFISESGIFLKAIAKFKRSAN